MANNAPIQSTTLTAPDKNASDLPLLSLVGEPIVVNPDPRLRREAERRRWPILRW